MLWKKEEILFGWVRPKDVSIQFVRVMNKQGKTAVPRIIAFITILLLAIYLLLDYLVPPEVKIGLQKQFFFTWISGAGMVVFLFFLAPYLDIFEKIRYQITSELIRINGRTFKWKKLTGFVLPETQTIPGLREIILLTNGRPRTIFLPKDNPAEQVLIIQYIAGRLQLFPSIPESYYPTPLTLLQKCCFALCTLIYSIGLTSYAVFGKVPSLPEDYRDFEPLLFLLMISLFGPGTICSVIMFGTSFFKNKYIRGYSLLYNFTSLILLMFFIIILFFWKIRRDVGGW